MYLDRPWRAVALLHSEDAPAKRESLAPQLEIVHTLYTDTVAESSASEPTGVDPTPVSTTPVDDHPRQELPKLPTRRAHNQSMAATLRLWHTRNLDLLERVATGLRHLDHPAACTNTDPIRGRAHAIHLMADHTKHNCPRFQLAAQYIEAHQ